MTGSLRLVYVAFCLAIAFATWLLGYGLALKLLYGDGRIIQATITTNPWAPLQQLALYAGNPVLRRVCLG
ncbi:type IV secretory system conjugative DNA transfer family protein, partial [Mesorhizobium sp. M2A.F.Ca.ET.039.01.1.1]